RWRRSSRCIAAPRIRIRHSAPKISSPRRRVADGRSGRQILRDRTPQDVRRARVDPARRRPHRREPPRLRGLLPARDAADDHRAAARGDGHRRPVRRVRDRRRWRTDGSGRCGAPRPLAGAGSFRRQVPAAAQEGGPSHPRSADARAEEVRPARRPPEVPVLEAVVSRRPEVIRAAVAGASGYMGAELLRLLSVHPKIELTGVTSDRLAGEPLGKAYPHLRGLSELRFHDLDPEWLASVADVVFLALPHMESQKAVPVLRRRGCRAIDLSADYRLRDANDYVTWYKAPHIDRPGLAEAVYGLPELHRKAITGASLVAAPGRSPPCSRRPSCWRSTASSTRTSRSCAFSTRVSAQRRVPSSDPTSATSRWSRIIARTGPCACRPSTTSARAARPTASRTST